MSELPEPGKRNFVRELFSALGQKEGKFKSPYQSGFEEKYGKRDMPEQSFLRQVFSFPRQPKREKKVQQSSSSSGQDKKRNKYLPKTFKRADYEKWLRESSRDLSGIFNHRLSKRQIMEKGMAFLPPRTGAGYVEWRQIEEKKKELEKKYRDRAYYSERANIRKDLEFIKRYEEKLREPSE